jgi:hypothetical protein
VEFTPNDLIARARVYCDDDVADTEGWISPAVWLTIFNVERSAQYRRWVRAGLVTPATTDTTLAGAAVPGVLAVVGVAEDLGSGTPPRVLTPSQSAFGRNWSNLTGKAMSWSASGAADAVTITLDPTDASGTYFIRYVPTVAYATDATAAVDIPYGTDERLVLGMARRAHLKDSAASRQLQGLILEADADLQFTAFGRLAHDAPRVRRVVPTVRRKGIGFPDSPTAWRYF